MHPSNPNINSRSNPSFFPMTGTSESYPPIEPSNFDLIVIGTGLPESIIAAATSTAGKTILHLDPNPFYGSHYSSPTLTELTSFLQSQNPNNQSGPRVLFCADVSVDLLLKSSANRYVEFKNKDKSSKFSEKNQLNRFFKPVQGHLEAVRGVSNGDDERIVSSEDLESPFVAVLDKIKLPAKIISNALCFR